MKEDFLHYIWLHKKLDVTKLFTLKKEKIEILSFGQYLQTAGPDFFNAQLIIGNQKWAGNIEIHLKSSDWYLHNHEIDENYNNVILHVVWEHDVEIYRKNNLEIPVLELKQYVSLNEIDNYKKLMLSKTWINCENQISNVDKIIVENWKERLFFERLERKSKTVLELLKETKNDWDAVLFCLLAKNFGLNTNGEIIYKMAKELSFAIIRKESNQLENIEALFYGCTNLLNDKLEDTYFQNLNSKWKFLKNKYRLNEKRNEETLQFYKLRPDNFPTIRLSQLAVLYHTRHNIFQQSCNVKEIEKLYELFAVKASKYWDNHYNFDKESTFKKKLISKSFIDLIIINTIIPLQFAYLNYIGKDNLEEIIHLIRQIQPEKNSIIKKFNHFNVKVKTAFDSQSLLQLKKEYCDGNRCLSCNIGISLIKN
ncbi:DUF2851 family protein [Flavobacterium jejuense]|uniref:DUF2851 family protein n=1 Tax=Flavobacterium jejuense TaxID=1544455 RepID=A0ABX0IP79_9FLAO|nr:DUF2851 family protein [Flavobacterium jejuense]NHN25368.1 DUF2851 family protein [Flavobacterium jejuense]